MTIPSTSYWLPVSHSEGLHEGPTQITIPTSEAAKILAALFAPYGSLKGADTGALVDAVIAFGDGRIAEGFKCFGAAKAGADEANPDDGYMVPCMMTVVLTACGQRALYGVRVESAAGCRFDVKIVDYDRRMMETIHGRQMQFGKAIEITVDTGAATRRPMYNQTRETHGYGRLGWLYGALHNAYWAGVPMDVWVEHRNAMDAVATPPVDRRQAAAEGRDVADPPPASTEPPVSVRKPRPQREEG